MTPVCHTLDNTELPKTATILSAWQQCHSMVLRLGPARQHEQYLFPLYPRLKLLIPRRQKGYENLQNISFLLFLAIN